VLGLECYRRFLADRNPAAARRAGEAIERHFLLLEATLEIGRPFRERLEWRELLIDFGDSGYSALYFHKPDLNEVYVLAFRHQKEAGY